MFQPGSLIGKPAENRTLIPPLTDLLPRLLPSLLTDELSEATLQALEIDLLSDRRRMAAFGIEPGQARLVLLERLGLLRRAFPEVEAVWPHLMSNPTSPVWQILWQVWLPLALSLAQRRQNQDRPFVQGVLGGQGTGKTTLAQMLALLLPHLGYRMVALSLDDLYLTYRDRLQLQQQDPRLIWRGPPGTHEVDLGIQVLDALRQPTGAAIALPRFDKSLHNGAGDRIAPEWVSPADIILFEGWFVGVRPVDPAVFDTAPEPICTEADRQFARDICDRLQAYLPLWQRLDSLMVLYPTDYRFSKQWRRQAEQRMKAAGKPGMSDPEIDAFVDYFWQALHPDLFIRPLVTTPGWADLVIELDQNHLPGRIYPSGEG